MQQYCWHMLVDTVWEAMRKKNKQADDFLKKRGHLKFLEWQRGGVMTKIMQIVGHQLLFCVLEVLQ
eukprot:7720861-Ditylum_brightwellii.AAC.1